MKTPTDKTIKAFEMRSSGMKFKEIGKILGCSSGHARHLFERGEQWENEKAKYWFAGITGIGNIFANYRLLDSTMDEIADLIKSGKIKPGFARLYGPKTHKEICDKLGIEFDLDEYQRGKKKWKFDPISGKPI